MDKNKKSFFTIAQKALQKVLIMIGDKNFNSEITAIREKHLKQKRAANNKNTKLKNLLSTLDRVEKLRVKYKLSEPHFVAMAWVVIYNQEPNEIDDLYKKTNFKIITNKHGEEIMYIPVYPETTIEDIREIFSVIKKNAEIVYGKENYKRLKRKPKLSRDLAASRLKSFGHNNEEIKQILSNQLGFSEDNIIKEEIPKIINKLRKSVIKAKK